MARKPAPRALENGYDPLRDQIAIRVMEILVGSNPVEFIATITMSSEAASASFKNVATISYAMADAMLKERR